MNRFRLPGSDENHVHLKLCNLFGIKKELPLTLFGTDITIRTCSPDVSVAIHSLGNEFSSLRYLKKDGEKMLIIDAGGYIGTAAITFAKIYPEATIITIEPSKENFQLLLKNIAPYKNIIAKNCALVAAGNGKSINLNNRGTGQWGFTIIENPDDTEATFLENVETITFDEITKDYQSNISLCKMDIEGAEVDLLRHPDWLNSVEVLMIELHERIVPGCEEAFWSANKKRFVEKTSGEKFLSVGSSFFH